MEPDPINTLIIFFRERPFRKPWRKRQLIGALLFLLWSTLVGADKDGDGYYGSQMPMNAEVIPIDQAITNFESSDKMAEFKFSGRITEVCKKKGCWMILAKGLRYARVTFEDYLFFVPTDSIKANAVVYGRLNQKKLSRAKGNHYEEDPDRTPTINSDQIEYQIVATSVVINK